MVKHKHATYLCLLITLACLLVQPVFATTYGSGAFSNCSFTAPCPNTATSPADSSVIQPSTVVILPSKLQVRINLHDGQVIPAAGYMVIVTPISPQGVAIRSVIFSINGRVVQTANPDADGVVRWQWDPQAAPGNQVDVHIVGTDSTSTKQGFSVVILRPTQPDAAVRNQPATSFTAGVTGAIESVFVATYWLMVYIFPYALFGILALNGFLILLQEQREFKELRTMHAYVNQAETTIEQKHTFIALASHYLRTPLSIILGSLDMLPASSAAIAELRAASARLHDNVEALLQRATLETDPVDQSAHLPGAVRRYVAVFMPVVLLGCLAAVMDILAQRAADLTLGQTDLMAQWSLYIGLVLATLFIFRSLQLHVHDKQLAGRLLNAHQRTLAAQEEIISSASNMLNNDLHILEQNLPAGADQTSQLLREGTERFRRLLNKFSIATKLRGIKSDQAFIKVRLVDLINQTKDFMQEKDGIGLIQVGVAPGAHVYTRNPILLSTVLASLLDNALAYNQSSSPISITEPREGVIRVADRGSGIPRQQLTALFDPFVKAEGAEDFTHEGMGFNLYLDKLIMSYLGGGIVIDSKEGSGTIVTITLPTPENEKRT